jgi:hypothetical protein
MERLLENFTLVALLNSVLEVAEQKNIEDKLCIGIRLF